MVNQPIRGANILDMLLTSNPGIYTIKVVASTVNTDHMAVIGSTAADVVDRSKRGQPWNFRKSSPNQHAALLRRAADYVPVNICYLFQTRNRHKIASIKLPSTSWTPTTPSPGYSYIKGSTLHDARNKVLSSKKEPINEIKSN